VVLVMRFSSQLRLQTKTDFSQVFAEGKKSGDRSFLLIAKKNSTSLPRLGLAVSKKNVRLASNRNHIKRLIRESFRQNADSLPAIDVVVLVKTSINPKDTSLYEKINRQWMYIKHEKSLT
jgi:ribonuclease P protein component